MNVDKERRKKSRCLFVKRQVIGLQSDLLEN